MSTKIVTVAAVMNSAEAQFAVNRLNDAGIEAAIADDNVVSMDFLFGNAVGWIKVQVREQDVERAEQILDAEQPPVNEEEIPWDEPPEEADDETADEMTPEEKEKKIAERAGPNVPEAGLSEGEKIVNRAYRISIAGFILFPPLPHLFALYLLLKVAFVYPELPPGMNMRFWLTFGVALLTVFAFIPIWLGLIVWTVGFP